jgi:hypothetical protein
MIVRISGEDQFRVDGSHEARLTELDNAVLEAIERGDEAAFDDSFEKLIEFVRSTGTPLAEDELEPSDVILPPADTTITEAANDFTGEGWLPD